MNKQEISNIVLIEEPERSQLLAMKDVKLGLYFNEGKWFESIELNRNYFVDTEVIKCFINKNAIVSFHRSVTAEWFDSEEIKEATEDSLDYICAVHGVDLFFKINENIFEKVSFLSEEFKSISKDYKNYGFIHKRNFVPIPYIQGTNWVTKDGKDWSLDSE